MRNISMKTGVLTGLLVSAVVAIQPTIAGNAFVTGYLDKTENISVSGTVPVDDSIESFIQNNDPKKRWQKFEFRSGRSGRCIRYAVRR